MISPAVFTNENDQSYLPSGISEIGAAVIGPTPKGEAFVPTTIESMTDYNIKFGTSDGNSYVPYTVRNYLKNASSMTVTRILGLDGYNHTDVGALVVSSSHGERVVGILHHSTTTFDGGTFTTSSLDSVNNTYVTFSDLTGSLLLSGSGAVSSSLTISPLYTSANYYGKVLGRSPKTSQDAYLYTLFSNYNSNILSGSEAVSGSIKLVTTNAMNFSGSAYSPSYTPWITSQLVGGSATNLFRFRSISHGENINETVKISISNIKKGSEVAGTDYGTFSVMIRDITDNDRSLKVLEQFNSVTLDPDSPNYIERIIGDKYATYSDGKLIYSGDYSNKSKYISVVVTADVKSKSISPALNPWGFAAIKEPALVSGYSFPTASLVTTQEYNSEYNEKIYYGFNFDFTTTDNKEYLKPILSTATAGLNAAFNLDSYTVHASASGFGGNSFATDTSPLSARKFNVPFQEGFSGMDPAKPKYMGADITATNMSGFDISSATSEGYRAYNRALTLLENQDVYDINLIFTPGAIKSLHSSLIARTIDMVESRGDVFYVFDGSPLDTMTLSSVTDAISTIDSSYAATYYPWVKQFDSDLNKYMWVPASVAVAGAYSFNDKVGYEWFAPAGLNRGAISTAVDVYNVLKQTDRDTLYAARVNPIATFPAEGIVVWGQKTLQALPSALDRVNVRRLLIRLKKFFASTSRYLIFEQNTAKTRTKFLNIVNPYMEDVQQKQGLYIFKVVVDQSNNTADVIDRNILKGAIYIQPAKTAEFIQLDFNIMPSGAVFDV